MFGGRLNPKALWHAFFGNPYRPDVIWRGPILLDENDVEWLPFERSAHEWHIRPISWMPEGETQALPLPASVENLSRAFNQGTAAEKAKQIATTANFVRRMKWADEAWARGDTDA
jgi:hypothetical protein